MAEQPGKRILRYALELAIVFVGVWLSLLAEDYRQGRIEHATEVASLERLLQDFEWDLADMQGNLNRAIESGAAAEWIVRHGDLENVDPDSLSFHLTSLQKVSYFVPNTSEYTSLRSSGQIGVIQDTEFRRDLTRLYEFYPFISDLHAWERETFIKALESISEDIRMNLPGDSLYGRIAVTGDPSEILGNSTFLLQVAALASARPFIRARYEWAMRRIEALQEQAQASLH